jgi:hypothetical protein
MKALISDEKNKVMMHSIYRVLRDQFEARSPMPTRLRYINEIEFSELEEKVTSQDPLFAQTLFESLFSGDVYIVKGAFSREYINSLKRMTVDFFNDTPSTFHKMVENTPNFHRQIDEELSKNYSINAIKHAAYFFPWNKESKQLFREIDRRWRLFKFMGGFSFDEYIGNTPKDEVVDRIQICIYPKGSGALGSHSDPFHNQRFFISGYFSKRGLDYDEGGFYAVDQNERHVDAEGFIDVGDMGFGYATIHHGVKAVDPNFRGAYDPMNPAGRWFLGLYSNDSDVKKNRTTAYRV